MRVQSHRISRHVATSDSLEDCSEQLDSTIKEMPRKDLIIQGNWNARVGREQRDGLEPEKPMKEEKDFWRSQTGTR